MRRDAALATTARIIAIPLGAYLGGAIAVLIAAQFAGEFLGIDGEKQFAAALTWPVLAFRALEFGFLPVAWGIFAFAGIGAFLAWRYL